MAVRAKFTVDQITYRKWSTGKQIVAIEMHPVVNDSAENKAFFGTTPTGNINIQILNPDAYTQFELDKSYYVDFTPADEATNG